MHFSCWTLPSAWDLLRQKSSCVLSLITINQDQITCHQELIRLISFHTCVLPHCLTKPLFSGRSFLCVKRLFIDIRSFRWNPPIELNLSAFKRCLVAVRACTAYQLQWASGACCRNTLPLRARIQWGASGHCQCLWLPANILGVMECKSWFDGSSLVRHHLEICCINSICLMRPNVWMKMESQA